MSNDFLDENYKEPELPSNYTKIEEGETVLRILAKPQMGWQGWRDEVNEKGENVSKPVRVRDDGKDSFDVADFDEDVRDVKFFWVMPVWNYNEGVVQIWNIPQTTIRKALVALNRNKAWGNPVGYDLSITRTGKEKQDTKYTVMPNPKAELESTILVKYNEMKIDWDAWWVSDDPFQKKENSAEAPKEEVNIEKIPF